MECQQCYLHGIHVQREQPLTFGNAFYYVIVTIITVGYGDISPNSSLAKMFKLACSVNSTYNDNATTYTYAYTYS